MDKLFKIENDSEFKNTLEQVVMNCYNKTTLLNEGAKEEMRNIIQHTNCDSSKVDKLLTSKGYDKERISYFLQFIESNKNHLLYLTIINHNSTYGETISSFDWILKLVYGTSELKNLKYPLLQLSMKTCSNKEQMHKTFDISKDMLTKLIDTLEATEV